MDTITTIKSPRKTGGIKRVKGHVVFLKVLGKKYKFLLQLDEEEQFLTHFDSGYKIRSLTPASLNLRRHGYLAPGTKEGLEKLAVETLVMLEKEDLLEDLVEQMTINPKLNR